MPALDSSILTICLAVAATYLLFSIFVQTVQEAYKYLTNSKGRAYSKALEDFIGPLAKQLAAPGGLPNLRVRGPFQFVKLRPGGKPLPLSKEQLAAGLERTASPTVSQALDALNFESQLQNGQVALPSPAFVEFLNDLLKQTNLAAQRVSDFLIEWCPNTKKLPSGKIDPLSIALFDAERVLTAFRRELLPHVDDAITQYPQFMSNFEYTYRRGNLRLTFIIAFLTACVFHLSFQNIYQNALKMPPEKAVSLANEALTLYTNNVVNIGDTAAADSNTPRSGTKTNAADRIASLTNATSATNRPPNPEAYAEVERKMVQAAKALQSVAPTDFLSVVKWNKLPSIIDLLGYLISAFLVSFGAPFWNDIASYLLTAQKKSQPEAEAS